MNWTERRERFRAILSDNRCVHPGSVYDAVSARIAEDLGFEVGMFSGSIGSMSVLGAPDLDGTLKRAKAYEAAGVDAVFLAGGVTVEAVEAVSSAIRIPLILGGGSGQLGDLDWLGAHRVRVALQTHAPFSAAVQAVYDTLKALRDGVPPRDLKNVASPELIRQVTRADDYQQWTKDFLGGG